LDDVEQEKGEVTDMAPEDRAHYTHTTWDDLALLHFGVPPTKEECEVEIKGRMTDQFDDSSPARMLFRKHKNTDRATIDMSIKKRLRLRTGDALIELMTGTVGGTLLTTKLVELLGTDDVPFDDELFDQMEIRAYENLLSKPNHMLANKSYKADPTFPDTEAILLHKQQALKKIDQHYAKLVENHKCSAKAGQLLTEFNHDIALELVPVFMYILKQKQRIFKARGLKIYYHPGNSDSQLNDWTQENFDFTQMSTEDDAEAWDGNMGPPFIQNELAELEIFNIPHTKISRFRNHKMNMHCYYGMIAFMMFSGGQDTLPVNTGSNHLYQEIKYNLSQNPARMFAGDDVAINCVPDTTPVWAIAERLFNQKFTRIVSERPRAFGWRLTPHKNIKDPQTTLAKVIYSGVKGELPRTIEGLMRDCATWNNHPELAHELSAEELVYCDEARALVEKHRRLYGIAKQGRHLAEKRGGDFDFNYQFGITE